MKNERFILWLMVLLIFLDCFIILETFPEFYIPTPSKIQEVVSSLSGDAKGAVQRELVVARWSGENAEYVAKWTLGIDAVLFTIVGGLIIRRYRRSKDEAS